LLLFLERFRLQLRNHEVYHNTEKRSRVIVAAWICYNLLCLLVKNLTFGWLKCKLIFDIKSYLGTSLIKHIMKYTMLWYWILSNRYWMRNFFAVAKATSSQEAWNISKQNSVKKKVICNNKLCHSLLKNH